MDLWVMSSLLAIATATTFEKHDSPTVLLAPAFIEARILLIPAS